MDVYVKIKVKINWGLLNIMNGLFTAYNPRLMCEKAMDIELMV